jgi:hypothetical protein
VIFKPFSVLFPEEVHKHSQNGKSEEYIGFIGFRIPAQYGFHYKYDRYDEVGDFKKFKIFCHG